MTRTAICLTSLLLLSSNAIAQQRLLLNDRMIGDQRITNIQPLNVPQPPEVKDGQQNGSKAEGKTMSAQSWVCGRRFTDGDGNQWLRISGSPVSTKPNLLRGWEVTTDDGRHLFMTTGGTVFQRQDPTKILAGPGGIEQITTPVDPISRLRSGQMVQRILQASPRQLALPK